MKICVLGAGAWGTALAVSASSQDRSPHALTLWARDAALVTAMQSTRQNQRYLPGAALPESLQVTGGAASSLEAAVAGQDLIIIATPMAGLRSVLLRLQAARVGVPVAWLCKGFESPENKTPDGGLAGPRNLCPDCTRPGCRRAERAEFCA